MSMSDQFAKQQFAGFQSNNTDLAAAVALKESYERQRMLAEQNSISPSAPVQTLASALTHLAELNKRLHSLVARSHQFASVLGGPFPIGSGVNANDDPKQRSVMEKLNEDITTAHALVSDIENCMGAMGRSLGTT